jgi:predicted NACHT family NTPase
MEKEILNSAITSVTPLIQSLVDVYVTPKLKQFRDKDKNKKLPTKENFTEYFHRTFKRLAVMNTLVFHNSQLLLTEIYIPLSIRQVNKQQDNRSNDKIKIDTFPQKLSDDFHNILITDTAGMGKSTMMKKVFISAIYEGCGIPLFIELRRLNKNKTLLDEIQEQLNSLEKDFDRQLLLEVLIQGDFIIILDGYDEITLSDKEIVTADIQDFISKASNNKFFITSRPENALSCFGNFQEFRIEPLNKNEAFTLLRKYDNQGKVSSLLIEKLKEKGMENIDDFLTNPLLVTLLFTAFEYKQTIPLKKYLFYRQVFDSNFEMHDLTKGDSYIHEKKSKLQIDDFDRVLRYMGFYCFKQQKIEFSKDELLQIITKSKLFCVGLSFSEHDFLDDLILSVPLFTKDGN